LSTPRGGQEKLLINTSTHQLSNEQLTWIEGIGNTEQQQLEEAKAKHFDIARKFKFKLKELLACKDLRDQLQALSRY
jgi:hypothetical protein